MLSNISCVSPWIPAMNEAATAARNDEEYDYTGEDVERYSEEEQAQSLLVDPRTSRRIANYL